MEKIQNVSSSSSTLPVQQLSTSGASVEQSNMALRHENLDQIVISHEQINTDALKRQEFNNISGTSNANSYLITHGLNRGTYDDLMSLSFDDLQIVSDTTEKGKLNETVTSTNQAPAEGAPGLTKDDVKNFLGHIKRGIRVAAVESGGQIKYGLCEVAGEWSVTKPKDWRPQFVDHMVKNLEICASKDKTNKAYWNLGSTVTGGPIAPKEETMLQYIKCIPDMRTNADHKAESKRAYKADDMQLVAIQVGRGMTRNVTDAKQINAMICAVADIVAPTDGAATSLSTKSHKKLKDPGRTLFKGTHGMLRKLAPENRGLAAKVAATAAFLPVLTVSYASALITAPISIARDLSRDVKNVNKAVSWIDELVKKIEKSGKNGTPKMTLTKVAIDACARVVTNGDRSHLSELDRRVGKLLSVQSNIKEWDDAKLKYQRGPTAPMKPDPFQQSINNTETAKQQKTAEEERLVEI